MNDWLVLVLSLPTENATARMRAWRALKASGAAVLRDGVYLLPQREACHRVLFGVATDVQASGGTAHLLKVTADEGAAYVALFDRSDDYASRLAEAGAALAALAAQTGNAVGTADASGTAAEPEPATASTTASTTDPAAQAVKQARKLRKALTALVGTDFFGRAGGEPARAVAAACGALRTTSATPTERHPQRHPQRHRGPPHERHCGTPPTRPSDHRPRAADALVLDVCRAGVFTAATTMLPGATWHDPAQVANWGAALPAACKHG